MNRARSGHECFVCLVPNALNRSFLCSHTPYHYNEPEIIPALSNYNKLYVVRQYFLGRRPALIKKWSSAPGNKKHPANERPGCSFVSSLIPFSLSYACSLPWHFMICKLSTKKRWSTSSCRPGTAGGSAPSLHTGAGSLTVRFTGGNADPGSQEYYCCRGPVVASNRSRICSKVTASISPRAYLWWSISKAEGCTGGMPYLP